MSAHSSDNSRGGLPIVAIFYVKETQKYPLKHFCL